MTRFCLIRHGTTDWNLEGRYQGQSDVPINDIGRAEAQALAWKLQGYTFAAIYSSDLKRAVETAKIIAAPHKIPVLIEPRLREINQGEWEGQHVDTIKAHYAELWQQRAVDPAGVRPPGGETVGEVAERVYAALDDIARLHPDSTVLIVSHGLALATVVCKLNGIPIGQAYRVIPHNAEPIWYDYP